MRELERRGAVCGFTDHIEAARHEQRRKRIACQRVVVDDENSLGHLSSHRQTVACRLEGRAEEEPKGHLRGVARRRAAAGCPARVGDGALPDESDPPQHL
jgi:hypothetical protein